MAGRAARPPQVRARGVAPIEEPPRWRSSRPGEPGSQELAPTGALSNDIWVATRASVNDPWETPVNVTAVNSAAIDSNPSFSRDGHWMFFNSDRPGSILDAMGVPSVDVWASYREHVHDNLDWGTPINLGPGVNTAGFDGGAIERFELAPPSQAS